MSKDTRRDLQEIRELRERADRQAQQQETKAPAAWDPNTNIPALWEKIRKLEDDLAESKKREREGDLEMRAALLTIVSYIERKQGLQRKTDRTPWPRSGAPASLE